MIIVPVEFKISEGWRGHERQMLFLGHYTYNILDSVAREKYSAMNAAKEKGLQCIA